MVLRTLPLALALLVSIGCQGGTGRAMTASDATEVTNGYLEEHLPQVPLNFLTIETADLGGRWRVIYRAPEGSTGGPMVFEVSKESGEIVIENSSIEQ